MNSVKKNTNTEKFIEKTTDVIRKTKGYYTGVKNMVDKTPLQIKIANIIVPLSLTYIFTFIYYNLAFSIIFAIITFLVGFIMSKIIAIIFIILYTVLIINKDNMMKTTVGKPVPETDIVKNGKPFDCCNFSLTVGTKNLPQDLNGGYFTYSFWIYVNGNNDDLNNKNTWNNYRYNEWKSIFYRGNTMSPTGDLSSLIQFPGVWLTPVINNIVIVFQNGSYVERLELLNIPLNAWTNISIVVQSKSVTIYVNGSLDRTLNLQQTVTIMNGYNLYVGGDKYASNSKNQSGFAGFLGELIYYNYALTAHDIHKSYEYYLKVINNYTSKMDTSSYISPKLITNSDYLSS